MAISSVLGSSALLPAGLGFRNKIINGNFGINQRAFTSTTTNGDFGFDRWAIGTNGGTGTYSTQAFTVGNAISGYEPINFARIVTSGQTGGNYAQLSQKIEDVRTCAGQQVTISFYAKTASGTPKVSVELQQLFGSGGSPSSSIFTYAGQVTLSTSWVRHTITVVVPSISGKTIGTTNDHSLVLNFFVSAGSGLETRSGSLGIQNNTFDFWGVQLEQNYQPTPFEQRPIGVELALCQRYYFRYTGQSAGYSRIMSTGSTYTGSSWGGVIAVPVTMRSNPTAIESSGIGVTDNVSYDSGAFTTVALSSAGSHVGGLYLSCTGAAGVSTNGSGHILILRGGASAYLGISAEL